VKTLREFFNDVAEYAKTGWNGEILPTWIAENEKGMTVYVTPWANETEKRMIVAMLKERFKEEGVFRYGMISETWVVTRKKDDPNPYDEYPSLEDHPQREEAITFFVVDSTNEKIHGRFMIRRDAEGNGTLDEMTDEMGTFTGRMATLIEPNAEQTRH